MERLTEWDEYGNADIIALSDMMPEIYAELSYSETNALTDALNRLAAYEDIGLTPEEVEQLKAERYMLRKMQPVQLDAESAESLALAVEFSKARQRSDVAK